MKVLSAYEIRSENVPAAVRICEREDEYINTYEIEQPKIGSATQSVLAYLKEKIIGSVDVKISEMLDPREADAVRGRFMERADEMIGNELVGIGSAEKRVLIGRLAHEMLGLGDLELLLADDDLEEIVVNGSKEPVRVYHKKFGWLKTNLMLQSEEQVYNYASMIGRRVGKQITTLNPLMDAHLTTGHRVNATLFPVSSKGNGITIRKFAKNPWTIVHLIDPAANTLNVDVAALLWLCVQYEMNIIVAGGTASGKTTFLNSILVFTPPNQRVISIEDTRELVLPDFLQWTPLTTREPNPEGRGEITMLDLMVNSLRMRPDRIVLGEIRRQREAEVLFEAMHTGHSVYSTLHADDAEQARNRMTSPPINLPESMIGAVHAICVQYRQRRTGIRRTFELAEVVPEEKSVRVNVLYKWRPRDDVLDKCGEAARLYSQLTMHTGMTQREIDEDVSDKRGVLQYMLEKRINTVNDVGRVIATYYRDKERLMKAVAAKKDLS